MPILVLNSGSSSLKASVLSPPDRTTLASVDVELDVAGGADRDPAPSVRRALDGVREAGFDPRSVDAVGHRIVHGGTVVTEPRLVDADVLAGIERLASLAPLHNAIAVATIRAAQAVLPDVPHAVVADTAFHAGLPDEAITYALPRIWAERWGIRRYGFHGIAVEWATRRTAELLGRPVDQLRIVVAHLGSGCSVTAVDGGRSVDTSMGMTPLEGLVMGTRSGSVDPGILLALLRNGDRSVDELADDLERRSGLLGLSGRSADVRVLLAAETAGDNASRLALAVFVRRAAAAIAAAATTMPSLDAITFSGGIGEHSTAVRRRIAGRLGALGVEPIGEERTEQAPTGGDAVLSGGAVGPALLRVAAREDFVIAEAVAKLMAATSTTTGSAAVGFTPRA